MATPASPEQGAREFELCLQRSLDLCHSVGRSIEKDVLDVDTAVSTSEKFKQKSTCGVMLNGTTVDNVVIGGPAYGKMGKGDVIKAVDGQKAKADNIATLLYGTDKPGSEVKIDFQTAKGQSKQIVLRRMKVEAIADKHHMFHLFTEVKKAAGKHHDSGMSTLVDQSIDHWTKMLIADAEHDQKVCDNVEGMQHLAQETIETLTRELESMKAFSETIFGESGLLESFAGTLPCIFVCVERGIKALAALPARLSCPVSSGRQTALSCLVVPPCSSRAAYFCILRVPCHVVIHTHTWMGGCRLGEVAGGGGGRAAAGASPLA